MSIRHWFFVGIDVSKDYSSAQGLDREGKRLFYLEFVMNDEGFSEFLKALKTRGEDLAWVTVGMDSSGCYHFNLFAFLCSEGMICVVINPLLISNFARLSLRKTKTDKKDTLTIAQFLLANGSKLSQVSYFQNSQDLKDLARERESLAVMITGLGTMCEGCISPKILSLGFQAIMEVKEKSHYC
jgi:transposase